MGNILDRTIQERLRNSKRENKRDKANSYLMMLGKINAAAKMLSISNIAVHSVENKVLKELQNKSLNLSPLKEDTLLHDPMNRVLLSYFDSINKAMVLEASSLTKGAGGPSQLDSEHYRHILSSRKFKKENKELRE